VPTAQLYRGQLPQPGSLLSALHATGRIAGADKPPLVLQHLHGQLARAAGSYLLLRNGTVLNVQRCHGNALLSDGELELDSAFLEPFASRKEQGNNVLLRVTRCARSASV
jgi:hypothetical protein